MATRYKTGDRVTWTGGQGVGEGVVREVFTEEVSREIKGTEITHNAHDGNPAYLIEQDNGDEVLKSHSDVEAK